MPDEHGNAGLGFRVKSGWASVVLVTGPLSSPHLRDNRIVDLSHPSFPETRQPYHARMGRLEMNTQKLNQRVVIVRRIAQHAIATLLAGYREKAYLIRRAILVVGSQIDLVRSRIRISEHTRLRASCFVQ